MLSFSIGRPAWGRSHNIEFIGRDGTIDIRFSIDFKTMEGVFPPLNEERNALSAFADNEHAIHAAAEVANAAGRTSLLATDFQGGGGMPIDDVEGA